MPEEDAILFREALTAAPPGTHAFVFDVGANNGHWSHGWALDAKRALASQKKLEVHLFEPQRVFNHSLRRLAATCNFTFVNAAVGKTDGQATMQTSIEGSMSASVRQDDHPEAASPRRAYAVNTINLASYLRERVPPTGALAFLKLDVEGMEYSLLPWLLLEGALCRLSHIRIEWHLASVPITDRLEALTLRYSLGALLRHGCADPPRVLSHEEYDANNFAFPVPGLQEIAARHTRWSNKARGGVHTYHWTQGVLSDDAKALQRPQSAADELRCLRTPPVCFDSCGTHHLRCNWNASAAAWLRSYEAGLSSQAAHARGVAINPWLMQTQGMSVGMKPDTKIALDAL